jgi:3-isopropylmalate dehydrogenase
MEAKITLLPGDGIGAEVVAEGRKILDAVAAHFAHCFCFTEALIGGAAIDKVGDPLPDATLRACQGAVAVLLGAVGGPKWSDPRASVRPEQGLLRLRQELGLYANLRPVRVHPALADASPLRPELVHDVDLIVVRELSSGIYFGEPRVEGDEHAVDSMVYSRVEIERIAHLAFQLARSRRAKVTSVDKANVLACSRLWRLVVNRVAQLYPDVELEHLLVDAATMHLVSRPRDFDVILTENMFGDILSDEASMLTGSLGMLPSASLGAGAPGLYEPVHGSAPDIAGKGIANPLATILSAGLLLRHSLRLVTEAQAVDAAVAAVLHAGYRTRDIVARGREPGCSAEELVGTQRMGDLIARRVAG